MHARNVTLQVICVGMVSSRALIHAIMARANSMTLSELRELLHDDLSLGDVPHRLEDGDGELDHAVPDSLQALVQRAHSEHLSKLDLALKTIRCPVDGQLCYTVVNNSDEPIVALTDVPTFQLIIDAMATSRNWQISEAQFLSVCASAPSGKKGSAQQLLRIWIHDKWLIRKKYSS